MKLCLALATTLLLVAGCAGPSPSPGDLPRDAIAAEMDSVLADMLAHWYPRAVDSTHGGYLSTFTRRWEPTSEQDKMIVTQARHTWTTARAAAFYEDDAAYLPMSAHGFAFLRDVMWDDEHGGFYWLVSREGTPVPEEVGGAPGFIKRAYGQAFAVYGLAAYYRASGDEGALSLAQEAFRWLEAHSHDPEHGGYFQFMHRDGTAMPDGYQGTPPKDQNSSIHLLEALTELYRAWPDPLVGDRLDEMLHLVRDTMVTAPGYLQLFFERDWTPVSYRDSTAAAREAHHHLDHVSFGHDVETAYLMLDAADALGRTLDPHTLHVGKQMVDHALRGGWDEAAGGFYDGGYYLEAGGPMTIVRETKNWWAQAEGLNALLMMENLFPDDEMRYGEHFEQLWRYTQRYLLDGEYGGWYSSGLDAEPESRSGYKGHIWKSPYHTARSLMECRHRLGESHTPHGEDM